MVVIALPASAPQARDARARHLIVDEDRAGAAITFAAAELRAGEIHLVSQHRQQAVARLTFDLVDTAVHPESIGRHGPSVHPAATLE